jgi:hypothetical protein
MLVETKSILDWEVWPHRRRVSRWRRRRSGASRTMRLGAFEWEDQGESIDSSTTTKWSPEQLRRWPTAAALTGFLRKSTTDHQIDAQKVSRGARSHLDDDERIYDIGDGRRWTNNPKLWRTATEGIGEIPSVWSSPGWYTPPGRSIILSASPRPLLEARGHQKWWFHDELQWDSSTWWRGQRGTRRLGEVGGELGFHDGLTGGFIGLEVVSITIFPAGDVRDAAERMSLCWAWIAMQNITVIKDKLGLASSDGQRWRRGSAKAARRCGARRCAVDHAGERKKKIFFSSSGSRLSA